MNDPLLGQQIGSYRVISVIGEGGFGRVYLAQHVMLGSRAALKVLHQTVGADPQAVERFFREARVLANLHHPNILQVFDFGTLPDGRHYMLMEYVEGRSLEDLIAAQPSGLPFNMVIAYASQIAAALAAAHANGIVHRDLKPENVVVQVTPSGEEVVKVLDFGIAKLLEESDRVRQTRTGQIMGTPAYMAPEQASGEPDKIGPWTDVYALGVMVFEMLSGKLPIEGRTTAQLLVNVLTQPPRRLAQVAPHVPASVEPVLMRALAKDPASRYQDARSFVADLAAALSGATPSIRSTWNESSATPTGTELDAPAPKGRTGLWATILVAAALVGVLVWSHFQLSDHRSPGNGENAPERKAPSVSPMDAVPKKSVQVRDETALPMEPSPSIQEPLMEEAAPAAQVSGELYEVQRRILEVQEQLQDLANAWTDAVKERARIAAKHQARIQKCYSLFMTRRQYEAIHKKLDPSLQRQLAECKRKYPALDKRSLSGEDITRALRGVPEYQQAVRKEDMYQAEFRKKQKELIRLRKRLLELRRASH